MEQSEKLGKYQIIATLGEGGMGIVYKAYDPHLARVVAIKTIRRSLLEGKTGQDLRTRFSREARAEGRLIHPNIITIYEYQQDEQGMPFFVMEYVDGKDLKQYLSRGIRFSLEKSLYIIEQVLGALALSHRQGIVHRDIKPANIILLEDDTVKIADFGIAKMEESEYTQTGMVMGTPQYISPEQRLGQHVDGRTDLYSTGAVLFELLTGKKPPVANSGKTLGERWLNGSADQLDSNDPKTRRIFEAVLVKALAKDPDDRFASAEAFLEAIAKARPQPEKPQREKYRGIVLGAIAGIGLLLVVYFFTLPQSPPRTPAMLPPSISTNGSTRVARKTPLSPQEIKKVQQQLKVAKTHMLVGRLVTPAGSNAFHSYNLALDIDPENAEANSGLAELQARLVDDIRQRIDAGDAQGAAESLEASLRAFPASGELIALQEQLK